MTAFQSSRVYVRITETVAALERTIFVGHPVRPDFDWLSS